MKAEIKIPDGFIRVKLGQMVKDGDYVLSTGPLCWEELSINKAENEYQCRVGVYIRKVKPKGDEK